LFDQTFIDAHAQTRRPWTVALSLALQTTLIAIALIVPLLHIASLDLPPNIQIWMPVQQVDLKATPKIKTAVQALASPRRVFRAPRLQGPTFVPRIIDMSPDTLEIANAIPTTGSTGPLLTGITIEPIPPQTPVVKAPPPSPAVPVRVGGGVQSAKLIFGPKPAYPPLARATRTQGAVRIQAVIARDGSIRDLQVLSGPPLLITAAMESVRQWRYQPTLLNGEPVEVITEIAVTFTLSQQ
jgi:protein TonB